MWREKRTGKKKILNQPLDEFHSTERGKEKRRVNEAKKDLALRDPFPLVFVVGEQFILVSEVLETGGFVLSSLAHCSLLLAGTTADSPCLPHDSESYRCSLQ